MGYWRLRNITKSVTSYPTLESLAVDDNRPCQVATFNGTIVDVAGTIDIDNEDEVAWQYSANNSSWTTVWAGKLTTVTLRDAGRTPPRIYDLAGQDFTILLEDRVCTKKRALKEKARRRVRWIMDRFMPGIGIGGLATVTDSPRMARIVDAYNYKGMTVREALEQVAGEIGATFYVDYDKQLVFFANPPTDRAPFDLSTDAVPPDTYPYWNFVQPQESKDLANAVRVQGKRVVRWRKNDASIAAYGRQERPINDPSIRTRRQARRFGDRVLNLMKSPIISGSLTMMEAGLLPIQIVGIANSDWGIDSDFRVTSTQTRFLNPNGPDDGDGLIEVDVQYADRIVPCYLRNSSQGDVLEQVRRDQTSPNTNVVCTWTITDADFGAEHINDIATDGAGTWVAVGSGGVASVSTDDAVTWTAIAGGPFSTNTMRGVAYGNGYWVAVGTSGSVYKLYTATDPAGTWTARTISGLGTGNDDGLSAVAYGNSIWVTVGCGASPGVYCIASTGSDPTTGWTARTVSDAAGHTQIDQSFALDMDVAFGNGRFVVVGGSDLATSTNGTAWTNYSEIANGGPDDSFIFQSLVSVAYGAGVWVLSGTSNSAVVSGNPATGVLYNDDVTDMWGWTVVNLTNGAPYCVAYGDEFLAIDGGGDVIASADGITWASDDSTFFTANNFWPYEYGGGLAYARNVWSVGGDTADAGPLVVRRCSASGVTDGQMLFTTS